MTSAAHDAVLHEFRAYYLADELPEHMGEGEARLMAYASAGRLRRRVGAGGVPAVIALLRGMRDDPTHPAVREVESSTPIEWTDEPEQWAEFREILGGIAEELERTRLAE